MFGFRSASVAALRKHSRGRPIRTPRGDAAFSNERPFLQDEVGLAGVRIEVLAGYGLAVKKSRPGFEESTGGARIGIAMLSQPRQSALDAGPMTDKTVSHRRFFGIVCWNEPGPIAGGSRTYIERTVGRSQDGGLGAATTFEAPASTDSSDSCRSPLIKLSRRAFICQHMRRPPTERAQP